MPDIYEDQNFFHKEFFLIKKSCKIAVLTSKLTSAFNDEELIKITNGSEKELSE